MERLISTGLALAGLCGCSLVYPPSEHMGGGMDAGTTDAGTTDAGTTDAGPSVDIEDYCDRVAALACESERGCCPRITDPSSWDDAVCLAHYHEFCDALIARVQERTYLIWDPHAAERSLQEGERRAVACDSTFVDWQLDRDGFFGPIVGGRDGGAECTPSRIDALEVEDALLSCEDSNRCIPGDGISAPWLCRTPSVAGDRCTFAFDCANPTHRCVSSGFVSRCRAAGEGNGSACGLPDECASRLCHGGECVEATPDNIFCPPNTGAPPAP